MNFDRHKVQTYFESKVGCNDITNWSNFKPDLDNYVLTQQDVSTLDGLLVQDSMALYIKSLQSFVQAMLCIKSNCFAWSIVKLYYSVFYALRSELAISNIIAIKNGKLYYAQNIVGEHFSTIQIKGDHKTYIKLRQNLPPSVISVDPLLGNQIENGEDVYSWMCKHRERVNYRMMSFSDPFPDTILSHVYSNYFNQNQLNALFDKYDNNFMLCFDLDHAIIAVPYFKLKTCHNSLTGRFSLSVSQQDQINSIKKQLNILNIEDRIINLLLW